MGLVRYTQEALDAAEGRWPARVRGDRRERPKTIRVFQNPLLEWLGLAPPALPILLWGGPLVYGLGSGVADHGLLAGLALFAGGWLFWTLLEYVLHRFAFHMEAHTEAERFQHFMLHGYHHEFPDDRNRLLAPPMMSLTIGVPIALLDWIFLGAYWLPVFAGTVAGYLAYDYIHFYTHHFRPRGGVGKWLRAYHMRHHFEDDVGGRYGVSNPLWDLVFGTYRPAFPDKVKKAA